MKKANKLNVLMVGVDKTSVGGMWTVVEKYQKSPQYLNTVNLIYVATVINSYLLIKILYFVQAYARILWILFSSKVDIVHIQMGDNASIIREGLVAYTGKLFNKKIIIHMHGGNISVTYKRLSNRKKKIVSNIFSCADKVVVLGNFWLDFMEELTGKQSKTVVIYNGVDVPTENKYCLSSKNIIFMGILVSDKGILDLLDVAAVLNKKLPIEIKFMLYGDDKYNMIHSEIEKRNLSKRVYFYGWLSNEKKCTEFGNAMLNILPSYHEGLPMTILETMAYGIPNIATNVGAISEIIQSGINGDLVEPSDVDNLEEKIYEMVIDIEKREKYSVNGYNTVKKKFSCDRHIDDILNLYMKVMTI